MSGPLSPSFRLPFESQISRFPPEHQQVVRTIFNKLTDLDGAINNLKTQQPANSSSASSSTATTSSSTSSVTPAQAASIATAAIQSTLGVINDQTGTSYTAVSTDYGGIITLDNAGTIAVTLGGAGTGVGAQWWAFFQNNGAGTATLAPASGTINGAADITLVTNQSATVFFDGTNWQAATSIPGSGGTITDVIAGTGLNGGGASGAVTLNLDVPVSIADGGTGTASTLTGLVRGDPAAMTAAELSGDATTSGSNAITLATVNPDVGSFTSANITVNGKGLITAAANGSGSGLPVNNPTFTGVITGPHFAANGSSPVVTQQTALGTGGAATLVAGNDTRGAISLVPGTGATTGAQATVAFAVSYATFPFVYLFSVGPLGIDALYVSVSSTAGFTINAATPLIPTDSYEFNYLVIG